MIWLTTFISLYIYSTYCMLNRSFDWSAIGEASSALFGIQSPLIKYYLYHFHFVLFPLPCNWNVVFISELLPTCQNYQKKVATKWEPCPKTCLKLRKSFQNELAGTTKLFEGLISLHFLSASLAASASIDLNFFSFSSPFSSFLNLMNFS